PGRWSASSTARATASSSRRWPTRWSTTWRRCAIATRTFAPTRRSFTPCSIAGRRRPARSPRTRWRRRATAWASGRPRNLSQVAVLSLDLDLEVFQGPFHLLLTLVLQGGVERLEVDLADVVLAYVAHLGG